tara:strand:+ start:40 stop:282 length:243 start_codon:yes stop_codon:yes gene_type:complete
MSTEIYKDEMCQIFEMNQKNFIYGDTRTIMDEIKKNDLKFSSFEEMFNIIVMNRENIRIGDYQQMYDLLRIIDRKNFYQN